MTHAGAGEGEASSGGGGHAVDPRQKRQVGRAKALAEAEKLRLARAREAAEAEERRERERTEQAAAVERQKKKKEEAEKARAAAKKKRQREEAERARCEQEERKAAEQEEARRKAEEERLERQREQKEREERKAREEQKAREAAAEAKAKAKAKVDAEAAQRREREARARAEAAEAARVSAQGGENACANSWSSCRGEESVFVRRAPTACLRAVFEVPFVTVRRRAVYALTGWAGPLAHRKPAATASSVRRCPVTEDPLTSCLPAAPCRRNKKPSPGWGPVLRDTLIRAPPPKLLNMFEVFQHCRLRLRKQSCSYSCVFILNCPFDFVGTTRISPRCPFPNSAVTAGGALLGFVDDSEEERQEGFYLGADGVPRVGEGAVQRIYDAEGDA